MAVHPVMTQAVGYIAGRSELVYGFFFLASILAARRWMRTGHGSAAVVAGWVLSLIAKESAAMLPLVLWCYDAWLMDDGSAATWRRVKALYAPLAVTVLVLAVARLAVLSILEYPQGSGLDWRYAFVALDAFWRYLALYVWPFGQSIMHTLPAVSGVTPRVVVNLVGVVALAVVVWRLRSFQAPISLGLVMSAAMLVPSTALFSVGVGEPMAEHRAYLSAMAFFLACGTVAGVAWDLARTTGRGTLAMAALGAACAAQLAGLTIIRNEVWGSTVALAREAVAYSPNHWMTRLFLGETLRQTGRCGEAITEYRTVIVMRPLDTFAYTKEVSCLLQTGQVHEAEHVLRELRTVDPQSQEASMGLALMAVARGQADESRSYFTEVLARDARRADARQFLALLDGSLAEPSRAELCGIVRSLAVAAAADAHPAGPAVCP
jgi:Flp pilus assembly protein TadD